MNRDTRQAFCYAASASPHEQPTWVARHFSADSQVQGDRLPMAESLRRAHSASEVVGRLWLPDGSSLSSLATLPITLSGRSTCACSAACAVYPSTDCPPATATAGTAAAPCLYRWALRVLRAHATVGRTPHATLGPTGICPAGLSRLQNASQSSGRAPVLVTFPGCPATATSARVYSTLSCFDQRLTLLQPGRTWPHQPRPGGQVLWILEAPPTAREQPPSTRRQV